MFWNRKPKKRPLNLYVTLWPSFPHFPFFAKDKRLTGIRLNTAMAHNYNLKNELELAGENIIGGGPTLYFDVKGKQLRITDVTVKPTHLEILINHKISLDTSGQLPVLFKAGADFAFLKEIRNGNHLIFEGGPKYTVKTGESICIRRPFQILDGLFTDSELLRIDDALDAGFTNFCLSYTESQKDVDQFREYVGNKAEILLKIENKRGLEFVEFFNKKQRGNERNRLFLARGDLFTEVDRPHDILAASRLIISKDGEAVAGSRFLLSVVDGPTPECADFSDLAWVYDIGYRNVMLCDEMCLDEDMLKTCMNVLEEVKIQLQFHNRDK